MRGATRVTLQLHKILPLSRKMNVMIDPRHIWNVISNARSKQSHPSNSPSTAPATKFWVQDFSAKSLNCFRPNKDDSRIIRAWSEDKIVISHPPLRRPYSSDLGDDFVLKNPTFRAPAISPKMSRNAAPATKSHTPTSPNTAPGKKCTLLFSTLFSLGIYSLLASILSWHLFPLGTYSLLASILSWHLFSLGIYSLLASILSWHLFCLGIYSLWASILFWHLFSLGIYSLLASILSWHLFSLGIYSLTASILSWHLFSKHLFSKHLYSLGIYSL